MVLLSLILGALTLQPSGTRDGIGSSTIPERIRAALAAGADNSFSDLEIKGSMNRRMLMPSRKVLETLGTPESESEFTQQIRFELMFKGVSYRESLRYPPGKYHSGEDVLETSFDGAKFFVGRFDPQNKSNPGSLIVTTPALSEAESKLNRTVTSWTRSDLWYLLEAGFDGPTQGTTMGRPVRSLVLTRAAAGKVVSVRLMGRESEELVEVEIQYPEPWQSSGTYPIETDPSFDDLLNGTDKLQMRKERQRRQLVGEERLCRFLLDGKLGFAVRERWEFRRSNGLLMFHSTSSDFVELEPGGPWLPKHCDVKCHADLLAPLHISSEPLYATVIDVSEIRRIPAGRDEFSLWYGAPGMMIQDYTRPNSSVSTPHQYTVTSSSEALDKRLGTTGSKQALILLANVLIICGIALYAYVKSRKKR
ncbi:hypothetical protein [Paludisphaera mucosa]|uniref:DUF1583 domain-containing protein n=1 Tax=Paludisphaera mucosa TaxID=3030827 RepID=A0ABT6FF37_9BACT|nr:hypothetical protein [Paludisphaera mucosa]MDG3005995.1 hypothetical protein [Paludisphaera mucosa]